MKPYALFALAGAAFAFFLDPQNGKRRRHVAWDRTKGFFRRTGGRVARSVASEIHGVRMKATHTREACNPQPNDATLVQKVESEVLRDPAIPRRQINVNAENGIVFLRGEVDSPSLTSFHEKQTRPHMLHRELRLRLTEGYPYFLRECGWQAWTLLPRRSEVPAPRAPRYACAPD